MLDYTICSSTWPISAVHKSCVTTEKKTEEGVLAGQRIKSVCRALGIDRKELAKRTKIGYSTLGNYEQGIRELGINEAKRIEKATGAPAAYLMGLIDEEDMELLQAPRTVRQAALQMIRTLRAGTAPPPAPAPGRPFPPAREPTARRRA